MSSLPNYQILDKKLNQILPEELRNLQSTRLVNMVNYVYDKASLWKRKFDDAGVQPNDINGVEDLGIIPFCDKKELLEDQKKYPPFGSYTCTDKSQWVKMFSTSGTTGTPLRRVFSARDWSYVLDRFQRNGNMVPGDFSIITGPVDGLIGPTAACESGARQGAIVVQAGLYDSPTKIKLIKDLRPVTISGTASYLLRLLEVASELGVDPTQLGLKAVLSVGEPGAAVPATKKRLQEGWNAAVIDGLGMTEVSPLGDSCPGNSAIHLANDMILVEIIDPDTCESLPPGEEGELVITNLVGDTQPLLRYRTRDISRLTIEPCEFCGHLGPKLEGSIVGRVDDMIWFRGSNIYPSMVENAIREISALNHEYQMVVEGNGAMPSLTIRVESATEVNADKAVALKAKVAKSMRNAIRIKSSIELLPPGSLPRDDQNKKIKRIIDKRIIS